MPYWYRSLSALPGAHQSYKCSRLKRSPHLNTPQHSTKNAHWFTLRSAIIVFYTIIVPLLRTRLKGALPLLPLVGVVTYTLKSRQVSVTPARSPWPLGLAIDKKAICQRNIACKPWNTCQDSKPPLQHPFRHRTPGTSDRSQQPIQSTSTRSKGSQT